MGEAQCRPVVRVWFKDGNYMDMPDCLAPPYETQPDWDRTEPLDVEEPYYGDDVDS